MRGKPEAARRSRTDQAGVLRVKLGVAAGVIALWAATAPALRLKGADLGVANRPMTPGTRPGRSAGGTVGGVVTYRGEVPRSAVPDDAGIHRALLEVDAPTRGLRHVVVSLTPIEEDAAGQSRLAASPVSDEPVTMDQWNHEFRPRVLAVRAGQPVKFTNSDPANHNVRTVSSQRANEFNVYTGANGAYTHRFVLDPEEQPVRVGCDIHPWMRGWIYVFDHPYFCVTDGQGRFRIDSVPPGRYRLVVRQPDLRYSDERPVSVRAHELTRLELEIAPSKRGPSTQ